MAKWLQSMQNEKVWESESESETEINLKFPYVLPNNATYCYLDLDTLEEHQGTYNTLNSFMSANKSDKIVSTLARFGRLYIVHDTTLKQFLITKK